MAVAPGEPFPGRYEPTLIAYTSLVRQRFSPWRSPGRFARARAKDRLELLTPRQVVVAHCLATAYVGEGGLNAVDREAMHLRPGQPVDGELQRIRRLLATGLPVDDLEATVGRLVHRVYSPTDHMPGKQQLERCLDGVRDTRGVVRLLEAAPQRQEIRLVRDLCVRRSGELVLVQQRLLPEA